MIEVLDAAPLATVQDAGRRGYRSIGVGTSGAIDPIALAVGNILVGNDEDAAGIEITMAPFRVRFSSETQFALTGAHCHATLDEAEIPPWWTMTAKAGQVLTVNRGSVGVRSYLSIKGGVSAPVVMGSRSTDMKGRFGGSHNGRFLKKGDLVPFDVTRALPSRPGQHHGFGVESPGQALSSGGIAMDGGTTVRVIEAAEASHLSQDSGIDFWQHGWTVTPESNRLGIRLRGPNLELTQRVELLSHGICPGVIQLPPGGQPIIQMSDANTTGGYPKIGVVIEADLWRLGQARIGSTVHFVKVSRKEAVDALVAMRSYVSQCKHAVLIHSMLGASW